MGIAFREYEVNGTPAATPEICVKFDYFYWGWRTDAESAQIEEVVHMRVFPWSECYLVMIAFGIKPDKISMLTDLFTDWMQKNGPVEVTLSRHCYFMDTFVAKKRLFEDAYDVLKAGLKNSSIAMESPV